MCLPVVVAVFGLLLVLVGVLVPATPMSQILVGAGIIVLTIQMFFLAIEALIPSKNNNNADDIKGDDSDE